ncbi:MAG TPA: hypothetical protein VEY09_03510 [Pyrinomonadaceae bacterium]|nr:hypothetical protein [Pyrinomonadaceae bacterium]
MAGKKGKAAKGSRKQGKGGEAGGPPSATPNELRQGRKGDEGASAGRMPKTGKQEVGRGDAEGGRLH